jgi:hypothetical protein
LLGAEDQNTGHDKTKALKAAGGVGVRHLITPLIHIAAEHEPGACPA